MCEQSYPKDSAPPSELIASSRPAGESAPLLGVSMCPHAKLIGCAFANKLALIVRNAAALGLSERASAAAPLVLRGHEGAVTQIAFSASRQWALSSSADCSAALWSVSDGALALRVDRVLRSAPNQNANALSSADAAKLGSSALAAAAAAQKRSVLQGGSGTKKPSKWSSTSSGAAAADLQRFSDAVRFAQFFYFDEFFVLASGNAFYLYKYLVDMSKSDIQRCADLQHLLYSIGTTSPSVQYSSRAKQVHLELQVPAGQEVRARLPAAHRTERCQLVLFVCAALHSTRFSRIDETLLSYRFCNTLQCTVLDLCAKVNSGVYSILCTVYCVLSAVLYG